MSHTPILQLRDVKIAYGAIEAVKGISLELAKGELVSLIGALCYAELASAVSNAGGLGTITALTQPSPQALAEEPSDRVGCGR